MVGKSFRRIFLCSVISLLVTFAVVVGVTQYYFVSALMSDIRLEAEYAARGINLAGQSYLEGLDSDHRITLIAADGTVLYDSRYAPAGLENHSDREEFAQALVSGSGTVIRYSETTAERYIYHAVKLDSGSVIRVSGASISTISLIYRLLLPLALVTAMAALLSYVLAKQISASILRSAEEIDLDHPENTISCPEMSPLLDKIHRLNQFIREHITELSRKQEEFGAITENMNEGFIVVNCRREIISYNSSAIRILGSGLSADRPTIDSLASSDPLASAVNTALEGKHNEQALPLDGAIYRIVANPVYHNAEITGVVIVILDVTEKENLEQMRREFTSNVSHELKTPLTSIRGAAEMLANGLVKPEDISPFADTICRETVRLVALIDDILRLSQLDEAGIVLEMESVDLYSVCSSVLERLGDAAGRRQITLSLNGESTVISGVPTIIDELVFNLCDNAVKYNVQGGSVSVDVGSVDGRPSVTVSDTGIGIGREHIVRIFERFYRVDKSRSRAIGGTGLGLSIVKHALAQHNADIRVESEEGKGTSMTILF